MSTILIFTGGNVPDGSIVDDLPSPDLIIAADSGYDIASSLGVPVDVVVGDMDSIAATELPGHVIKEQHPADKDQTDLDLAMELALREDPTRLVVVGGAGGRHDHELGVAALIASPRWSSVDELDWLSERSRVHVVRGRRILHGDIGATVSLIPVGGDALGITTRGLRWELRGGSLPSGSSRGLSNILTMPVVDIRVEAGCLLAIFPVPSATRTDHPGPTGAEPGTRRDNPDAPA